MLFAGEQGELPFVRSTLSALNPVSVMQLTSNHYQFVDELHLPINRRSFCLKMAGVAVTAKLTSDSATEALAESTSTPSAKSTQRLYKAVKWWMVEADSPLAKFELCQELGFDGMELESPVEATTKEILSAKNATGMPVHGLVDTKHWKIRLSSPDVVVRDRGREILAQAIRDVSSWGGDSVLLVPGKVTGKNETHDHVWKRSIVEINKVLPLASHLGVRVLIENVWNGFCETPEQLRDYIDEIASPWVGVYFDIGNVQKFSPSENWIRILGPRIVKLDVKDWGKSNGFCKIGDGDVDWPAVREALIEINFSGWCTAEVDGGGRERLADIAQRMDQVLEI